jgi:hypothetical protein
MTLKGETEVATLSSVTYDKETDEVWVTFKVIDPEYKTTVLQIGRRKDIKMKIRGEKLFLSSNN